MSEAGFETLLTPIDFRVMTHMKQCHVCIISPFGKDDSKVMSRGECAPAGHHANEIVIIQRQIVGIFLKQFDRVYHRDLVRGGKPSE